MSTIEKFNLAVEKYYGDIQSDANGRFRSWEWCYHEFGKARETDKMDDEYIDYLCLHLSFYLASWGMYRGSSFLLQKDYKVHKPIVIELMKEKYDLLYGCDCITLENNLETLMGLVKTIKEQYGIIREDVRGSDREITDTLVTKILMGTLGCVPAYDQYFVKAVNMEISAEKRFGVRSLKKIIRFYKDNNEELENKRKDIKDFYNNKYPQMKLVDMGFWQIGVEY